MDVLFCAGQLETEEEEEEEGKRRWKDRSAVELQ